MKKLDPGVAQLMRSKAGLLGSENLEAVEDALWDLFKDHLKGVRWLRRKGRHDLKEELLHHWIDFIQHPVDPAEVNARAEIAKYLSRFKLKI